MFTVEKDVPLKNSLGVDARASYFAYISEESEIIEAIKFAKRIGLPIIVVGDGTNILPRNKVRSLTVSLNIRGIRLIEDTLEINAGEPWDSAVSFAVENKLTGIEALSSIPGTAGAAPIQNIGAYGSEISDVLESVRVYDIQEEEFGVFRNQDCQFGYRDSLFKRHPNRFIVLSISIKLNRAKPQIPKYKDIENYFASRGISEPSLKEIRDSVIEIRRSKLPDYSMVPNAGSYFTNPIIEVAHANNLKSKFPSIPLFQFGDKFKVSAGWLIEKCGLKGANVGKLQVSPASALVLTNPKRAGFNDVMEAENQIKSKVFSNFGITLTREPVII